MNNKIILDLCGGTGAWSKPYKDAGYDVRLVTLPGYDVRNYIPIGNVYGILAAVPCTEFAVSGARWWKEKPIELLFEALEIVDSCMQIIERCDPEFWCLENPVGRLIKWMDKPQMYFNPCDYGDAYTKKTCLWGRFNLPEKNFVTPNMGSRIHFIAPGPKRAELRAITPTGFSQAFFKVNR